MSARFARPYAEALIQTSPASYDYENLLTGLASIARALSESRDLTSILANPSVPASAKEGIVEALAEKAGLDTTGRRFLQVVLRNRRFLAVSEIAAAIREGIDVRAGVVTASVTSAGPLAPAESDRVTAALAQAVGKKVRATFDVDANLLAGFVARVGSKIYDASALGALEQFKEEANGH